MARKKKRPAPAKQKLLSFDGIKSPQAEAFRTLRTNLQFAALDKEIKTILVTSSTPNEGKTTIAANLAIALAQTEDQQILLIDADLRNPTVNRTFNINNGHGLTNLLLQQPERVEELFHKPLQENITILTSGPLPPNPAELLASRRMNEALEFLCQHFDRIIIDSPPVLAAADASVLAARMDGTLLVVSAGEVDRNICIDAKEQLKKVNANLLGVVLNKVIPAHNSYYYYSGYYYASRNTDVSARL